MKLGIIVGHNSKAQGAVRKDTNESEFIFNSRIANYMEDYARRVYPMIETRVFFRMPGVGYTTQIKRVYAEADRWGADLTTELHFNATGGGSLMLTSGSATSMKFAQVTQGIIVDRFGQQDDGISTRRSGRGSLSLITGKAPAILVEPFHGDNAEGAAKFDTQAEEIALAEAYIDAAAETFDVMPRPNIEASRTINAATAVGQLGRLGGLVGGASIAVVQTNVEEVIGLGETVQRVLPWVGTGLAVAGVLVLFFGLPALGRAIEGFRREDHAKELR